MKCWFCNRVFGQTDIVDERFSTHPNKIKQTVFKCTVCEAGFLLTERVLTEPTKKDFLRNEPHR